MEKGDLFELVDKLIGTFEGSSLTKLTLEHGEVKLSLEKTTEKEPRPLALVTPAEASPRVEISEARREPAADIPSSSPEEGEAAAQMERITAPIVGTFYRAAAPDAHPFVEKDTVVTKGQVLCILEAMKMMNKLEADFDCRIVRVLVDNGELVEYGAPLFEVERV